MVQTPSVDFLGLPEQYVGNSKLRLDTCSKQYHHKVYIVILKYVTASAHGPCPRNVVSRCAGHSQYFDVGLPELLEARREEGDVVIR